MRQTIYLDYNASAPLRAEAAECMTALMGPARNPSSIHSYGRTSRQIMETARAELAELTAGNAVGFIFTSGGTEANNTALLGFEQVIASAVEHDAVLAARPDIQKINVTKDGEIDLNNLEMSIKRAKDIGGNILVSVMLVNNETGRIQPFEKILELCRSYDVALHSDMVQALGKIPIKLDQWASLGLGMASFSAHKIGGPPGVGALWVAPGKQISQLLKGGGQEKGRRSGTENIYGIAGFGAAAKAACDWHEHALHWPEWRSRFVKKIQTACPEIMLTTQDSSCVDNTVSLLLPALSAQIAVMSLDMEGFAISSGAACSSGKVQESHVMKAMGFGNLSSNVIRISFGWENTEDELYALADALIALYKRHQSKSSI